MSQFKNILFLFLALGTLITFNACSGPGVNNPGMEFMPDMGHSVAYEANIYNYYYLNTWDSVSVKKLKVLSMPRNPVAGTIPRGYAGSAKTNSISVAIPANGSVPYYYENTDAERARAMKEIIDNPFPITEAGLAKGKDLYNIFCGICHGEKGDGNGYLYDTDANPNAKYPAAPANFLQDTFYNSSNGRYYHAIMYGKGVMGGYKDKLSYEERWQVIHYIHALQAKEKKSVYNETENTFTSNIADVPGAKIPPMAQLQSSLEDHHNSGDGNSHEEGTESHGNDSPGDNDSHEGGEQE